MTLQGGKGINNCSYFLKALKWLEVSGHRFLLDFMKDIPGSDKGSGEKMLDSRITDSQGGGTPAKFTLTTKPVLTELLFGDIF